MKTTQQLRNEGFTISSAVSHAIGAIGCTRIESTAPFFYFNPRFCDRPEDVAQKLTAAETTGSGNRYGFTLGGDYHSDPDAKFPYTLVSQRDGTDILTLHESLREAEHTVARRRESLISVVKAVEPALGS